MTFYREPRCVALRGCRATLPARCSDPPPHSSSELGASFQNNPCCAERNCATYWKHGVLLDIKLVWNCLNWATRLNPAEMPMQSSFGVDSHLANVRYIHCTVLYVWTECFEIKSFFLKLFYSHSRHTKPQYWFLLQLPPQHPSPTQNTQEKKHLNCLILERRALHSGLSYPNAVQMLVVVFRSGWKASFVKPQVPAEGVSDDSILELNNCGALRRKKKKQKAEF